MKRIVSAMLVAGLLSVGASSALAAPRAAAPAPNATVVCTLGATTMSTASLVSAGMNPRAAQRLMDLIISMSHRFRGLSCSTPATTPPTGSPITS